MFDYKIKSIDLLKYNNYRSPLLFTIDSHFINSRFINFNLININKFYFKTKNNFFSYNAINCIYSNNFNILYEYFFNIFDKKDFFLRKQFEIIKIQFEREERDRRKNKNKHGKINKTKKKLFFKIFKRPRKYKNQNLSLNNYLYKFLLREIINFEENFNLCRLSFNSIYRSANMISLSYFNFMTNVNFIDRKIFLSGEEFDDMEAFFDNLKENQIQFDKPQLYLYNNHFPIILNSEMVEISFFSQKSKFFSLDFIKFYQFYVSNFFEFLLKKSLYLKVDTNFFKKYSNFDQVEKIVNDFRGHKVKFSRFFHISEMIEIIWYSFEFRDLNILSDWLIKMLTLINLNNHKKFLNLFQNTLLEFSSIFLTSLQIKGFFFKIKGKIGLTGNAKKKQNKIRIGRLYLSSKLHKIVCEKNISKTHYGVLGFVMILTY